jgi:death-on-curing protein
VAERVYLTVGEVLQIHRELIDSYGGSHGLRDKALLEAAVFRPQIGYYNSISEEAAALMESLANNHPFVDGNKRIAFAVTHTFLLVNGYDLEVGSVEAGRFVIESLERGTFRFSSILKWIDEHVREL